MPTLVVYPDFTTASFLGSSPSLPAGSHHQNIDDPSADDDVTYLYTLNNLPVLLALEARFTTTGDDGITPYDITSILHRVRSKSHVISVVNRVRVGLVIGGTVYWNPTTHSPGASYGNKSFTWSSNPDGSAWFRDSDIEAFVLEIAAQSDGVVNAETRTTRFPISITYEPRTQVTLAQPIPITLSVPSPTITIPPSADPAFPVRDIHVNLTAGGDITGHLATSDPIQVGLTDATDSPAKLAGQAVHVGLTESVEVNLEKDE